MKKIISLLLAVVLIAGCGTQPEPDKNANQSAPPLSLSRQAITAEFSNQSSIITTAVSVAIVFAILGIFVKYGYCGFEDENS
ncbi:MAG: hypothetical protein LE169_05495 [Endomicrobium sp.]|nr:hypothetical protein [Endomicrobium sp.]